MPESHWKYKARGCATGNWVTDIEGWQALEDYDSLVGRPADMSGARLVMVEALSKGGTIQQADSQSAYCQAPLKGAPKWLAIPPSLREMFRVPTGMNMPVFRVEKALYGLVR